MINKKQFGYSQSRNRNQYNFGALRFAIKIYNIVVGSEYTL